MKAWYTSRTILFNLLVAAPLMLEAVLSNLALIGPLVPTAAWPWVVAVLTIGNLWLRILTKEGIAWRKEDA